MKLLVSVTNKDEAMEAVLGKADIIDVKNPAEGSLGAHFPRIIRSVREVVPREFEVSAAIGDVPNLPGTVSLAALGAAVCEVDYVKLGMYGPKDFDSALILAREACRAVKEIMPDVKVVIAGYADYQRANCLNPMLIPEIVRQVEADVAMIDTKIKDGKKIFSFLNDQQLSSFIDKVHDHGFMAAIAGSLSKEDIKKVYELGADVIGFRTAACIGDRVKGRVSRERILELKNRIKNISR